MKLHPALLLPLSCLVLLLVVAATRAAQSPAASPATADPVTDPTGTDAEARSPSADGDDGPQTARPIRGLDGEENAVTPPAGSQGILASLTIFVLAVFVGFEVITKVPPMLHTPLMSGSNAISGITLVGALLVAGSGLGLAPVLGLIAVILATINVVGGFLVTHRMLSMFKKRK